MFIIDTDILSLFRTGQPEVLRRIGQQPPHERFITVITVEEFLTGWYSLLRQARSVDQMELAYRELADAVPFLSHFQILTYTRAAHDRNQELVRLKLNIGKMDLRIASIVLAVDGILVTRNIRDFSRVPGLAVEDWTIPPATDANGESASESGED